MNTKELKKKYPSVYKEFFTNNSKVISTNMDEFLAGSFGWKIGGPIVRKKIPLKEYIGIKETDKSNEIILGESFRVSYNGEFSKEELIINNWNKVKKVILDEINNRLNIKKFRSIKISVLIETFFGKSYNVSALISAAIYYHFGFIKKEDFEKIRKIKQSDLDNKSEISLIFDSIVRFSNRIDIVANGSFLSNTHIIKYLDSKLPVIVFQKPILEAIQYNNKGLDSQLELSKTNKYWFYRFNDLFNISENANFPIDLINVSVASDMDFSAEQKYINKHVFDKYKNLSSFYKKLFEDRINVQSPPDFYKDCVDEKNNMFALRLMQSNSIASLKFINELKNLYENQASLQIDNTIFNIINETSYAKYSTNFNELSSKKEYVNGYIKTEFRKINQDNNISIYNWCDMAWGGMLIYISKYKSIDNLMKILETVKKKYYPELFIRYIYSRDGEGEDGVILEQDITKKINSKYISNSLYKTCSYKETDVTEKIITREELDVCKNEFDVVLDSTYKDILINGKKLTSADIHSSISTIEILKILLKNKKVSSRELPESSYTFERGELQSKIITPLIKAVKKYSKKELELKIKGSLMDYSVEFSTKDVTFLIVEKMNI